MHVLEYCDQHMKNLRVKMMSSDSTAKRHHTCSSKIAAVPWSLSILILYCWIKPSSAFVALTQPRIHLRSAVNSNSNSNTRTVNDYGRDSSISSGAAVVGGWPTTAMKVVQRQQSRRRRGSSRYYGSSSGGAGSLKASMGFPPLMPGDIAEFVGRELQQQSIRHHWQSGFIGGSVGVMGTLTAIQLKINQVKELTSCPYCRSSGQLPCATCFGIGSVAIQDTVGNSKEITTTTLTCPCCRGNTYITCVNCKGDGRAVPLFLNKKVSRDPESEIEDVGYA